MLYLYLAVVEQAISSILIREMDNMQILVYFVSKALVGEETQYPKIEKASLAMMEASQKLKR